MSRIIKSPFAAESNNDERKIEIRSFIQEKHHGLEGDDSQLIERTEQLHEEAEEQLRLAQRQAEYLIDEAKSERKRVEEELQAEREMVEAELQQIREKAKEEGYQAGFYEGQQAGEATYEQMIDQAKKNIALSEQEYEKTIDTAEPVIVELATELAIRVIGKELTISDSMWHSMLEQVMQEVREHEHVKIYVHPNFYEQTINQKEELEQLLSHTEKLFIYPDAGLEEMGCVIESKYGRIDVTIDRQLQELKRQLLAKLEEGSNES